MQIAIFAGVKFNAQYADSSPQWTVVAARGKDTWDCEIVDGPDWKGAKRVFGGDEIRGAISQARMFERIQNTDEGWWAARTVGETLHYHNSFGAYVRGEVVIGEKYGKKGKMLMPTALVGAWREFDLPRFTRSGEVELGHHAKAIAAKDAWRPNYTSMYEYDQNQSAKPGDPRTMDALSLEPPPIREEWAAVAKYEKARMELGSVLSKGFNDPEAALREVKAALDELLK